jgi:hypothetical protein
MTGGITPGLLRVGSALTEPPLGFGSTADGEQLCIPFWWIEVSGRLAWPEGDLFFMALPSG